MTKSILISVITLFAFFLLPIVRGSDDPIEAKRTLRDYAPVVKKGPDLTNHPLSAWKKSNDFQLKLEIP